jgi:hypothetical protein
MARIITTIGGASSGGLTSAQVLAIVQANAGYEYIKFVPLNGTVSYLDVLSLDITLFSQFRLVCTGMNMTSGGGQTVYFYTGYNNTVDQTGNRYANAAFSMPYTSSVTYGNSTSSANSWQANYFGDAGSSYSWNPIFELQFTPSKSTTDVQFWGICNSSSNSYNGNIAGSHSQSSGQTNPNMFRIQGGTSNLNGSTAVNSGVYVLGIRKRTS